MGRQIRGPCAPAPDIGANTAISQKISLSCPFTGRRGSSEISATALRNEAGPTAALTVFCSIFGAVAGDLALAHGARGGVYIAGGIAEKVQGFLMLSPFRQRFEDKGRLTPYVAAIPTNLLIVNPDIALLGAARSGITLGPAASR
jgi:glucokinase